MICQICSLIYTEEYCPDCNCGECGGIVEKDNSGICEICGLPVCEDCQTEYTYHSQIDYSLHKLCLENSNEIVFGSKYET